MKFDISSITIYKYRYQISYLLVGLALIILLSVVAIVAPGGLSKIEMSSVVDASHLWSTNLFSVTTIDLPYHILQHLILIVFGISQFTIKLPSLLIAFVTAVLLALLLDRWFHRHIAVLATLIIVTNSGLLYLAQNGTPSIMYLFWTVWLLYFGTLIAKKVKHLFTAKVLFFSGLALSLYTPLSIYTAAALAITAFLHPHLRYLVKQLPKGKLMGAFIFSILALLPLALAILKDPGTLLVLAGIPKHFPNLFNNLKTVGDTFFGFWHPSLTSYNMPIFGLGSTLLVGIGIYQLIRTSATTQSYLILIWSIILVPIIIINPDKAIVSLLPLSLLLATGIDKLLDHWYSLFPRNPYARIFGLLPIIVLVGLLVWSGLERSIYGYHYSPTLYNYYSVDLSLLPKNGGNLIVSADEKDFYTAVASYNNKIVLINAPTSDSFIVSRAANTGTYPGYSLYKIVVSSAKSEADRFYIYKKSN